MKKYKCKFPECDYSTNLKREVDHHHIVPKAMGGSNKPFNLICLCPNHHRKIFVDGCDSGMHSEISADSIEIINMYESTDGKVMHYRDVKNKEYSYYFNENKIVKWK